jgi:plasmid stabilization system protein ParE
MKVRYSRRAQGDLQAICGFLDERAPAAARKVKDLIERISMLADFAFMAPESAIPGAEVSLARYPYKTYYEVEGEEIWIVHIHDARRQRWDGDN